MIKQLKYVLEQQTTADIVLANCIHTVMHVADSSDAACRCSTSPGRMCDRCNNIDDFCELHASYFYGNTQHMVLVICLCICMHMYNSRNTYVSTDIL